MPFDPALRQKIFTLFDKYAAGSDAIEVISCATTDGFPVCEFSRDKSNFDPQMMAAAASTLYSVSNAVSQQILAKEFKVTFIESEQGNIAFVALQLQDKDYVLSMSATQMMNIASLRMLLNRLATEIGVIDIAEVA